MTLFPFSAVLFDCDGVLVDSEPITNRVLAEMLGELGWHITTEESMNTFTGKAVKDEAALIESKTGFAITAEWLKAFRAIRRLEDPRKEWKFNPDDLAKRKEWKEYMEVYEDAFTHCTTDEAPWYVIPADQKWYRNLAIARVVVATLKDMDPQWPTLPKEKKDAVKK